MKLIVSFQQKNKNKWKDRRILTVVLHQCQLLKENRCTLRLRRANGRNKSRQCCTNNVACCLCLYCGGVETDATTPKELQQHATGCENWTQHVISNNVASYFARGVVTSLDVTCCVRLHTLKAHPVARCYTLLRRVVGSCCAKFETRKTFSYVQTDATTFNIAGRCCVRLHRALVSLIITDLVWISLVLNNLKKNWKRRIKLFIFYYLNVIYM